MIKKHKTLTAIPPIHVYINRINNKLVSEIKDGYKLQKQTPETIKFYGSTKKLIDKTKNGEKELKELKQFQSNVFKQIISISKSLNYSTLLRGVNLMPFS